MLPADVLFTYVLPDVAVAQLDHVSPFLVLTSYDVAPVIVFHVILPSVSIDTIGVAIFAFSIVNVYVAVPSV